MSALFYHLCIIFDLQVDKPAFFIFLQLNNNRSSNFQYLTLLLVYRQSSYANSQGVRKNRRWGEKKLQR